MTLLEKLKHKLVLEFRKPLISDNRNETLKLNRLRGHWFILIPLAIFLNYVVSAIIAFFINNIFMIKGVIHNQRLQSMGEKWEFLKKVDYFKTLDVSDAFKNLDETGSIGNFLKWLWIIGFFLFTVKKIYDLRVSYSDKVIKKGYEATNRWTTVEELFEQYQKVEMKPVTRIKIPLSEEKINELLESDFNLEDLKIEDGKDILTNYKKELEKDVHKDFNLEGYIFNKKNKPTHEVLKRTNWYDGEPGNIVSRWRDTIFVDDSFAHTFGNGTTSSGKTQMFVYTLIDICSRIRDIQKRCSFIIFDPKLELYKSSKNTLEERDYIVRLLNIDNPKMSAGFNPLTSVVFLYKEEKYDEAEQMAKTYAYSVFNSSQDDSLEGIWKKTATQLFTALIISQVSDCIELDKKQNEEDLKLFLKRQKHFQDSEEKNQDMYREKYYQKIKENPRGFLDKDLIFIPPEAEFIEYHENEKNINIYSVIYFFRDLIDRASLGTGNDKVAKEKKAENLLDDYFNARASDDYARSLYEISKSSAGKTKGSIYLNMQTELDMFALAGIANLTCENDIDILDIAYADKPVAIFLGIPAEDRSNHFLATTFISQVSQRLYKTATAGNGQLPRKVHFIFDEVGNMPQVYMLQQQVTINRAIGLYYHLWVQAMEQMEDVYGKYANNIIENCGNQIYIMSTGTETSEYFSKLLGNREVISVNRQGGIHSTDRNFTETPEERPLMYDYELRALRKGECVIARPMKRTDIYGNDIKPFPILNEIVEEIGVLSYIKCIYNCIVKRIEKGASVDIQNRKASFLDELKIFISEEKRYKGTALYYSYTYMNREFPNAKNIELKDICTESREHIDFRKRINDPLKTIEELHKKSQDMEADSYENTPIKDIKRYTELVTVLKNMLGNDYEGILGISINTLVGDFKAKIDNAVSKEIISVVNKKKIMSLI